MEELIDVCAREISRLFSLSGITERIHNGCKYRIIKGNIHEISISNEIGTDNYRIFIKFLHSNKSFYVDLLMRNDNYKLSDINIPLSAQVSYIKDRKSKIVDVSWCEDIMKRYDYDQETFIKNLNRLYK